MTATTAAAPEPIPATATLTVDLRTLMVPLPAETTNGKKQADGL